MSDLPTGAGPASPEPPSQYSGPTPPSGNRKSLLIVLAILGVLALIAAGVGIFALVAGADDEPISVGQTTSPTDVTATDPTPIVPTDTTGLPTELPTELPTDLPTDLPTEIPTDFPTLPTEGGPSEQEYTDVAQAIVTAARAGDCDTARQYTDDIFDTAVTDANLCKGFVREAMQDDDLDDDEVTFFGTYGAAVQYDEGHTYVSLVAQKSGPPVVNALIAY